MLTKLTIQGFKSIERQTIELGALNVLIGANGSGKSNLLSALSFFRASVIGDLDALVKHLGGADRLLFHGKKTTKSCFFCCEQDSFSYEQTLVPVAGDCLAAVGESLSLLEPEGKRYIESWRMYHLHDTSATAAVKSTCNIDDNRYLREDAANLAAYLYWLKLRQPVEYRRIVSIIQLAIPYFEDFVLEPLRRNEQTIRLEWKQRNSDAYFDADSLSDGSLRFVGLTTLLNQPRWAMPGLIVIDEPELGLHPLAIRLLAEMLDVASEQTQILVATQSVTLLDHFPPGQIIVADHDGRGSTFRRLKADDYQVWLENFSVGELWEKNVFGGRP
jgi:predicted ATPase